MTDEELTISNEFDNRGDFKKAMEEAVIVDIADDEIEYEDDDYIDLGDDIDSE